ncbi:MAG: methionyl-tRNA formyltransferase [Chloroflexota bacterium]|nr:methionyl-tRNA formyltransferase [Chloroflexota bacterium]
MCAAESAGGGERPRTIFLGTGRFAVPVLEALTQESRVELVGVVTASPKPAGRGGILRPSPVGLVARTKWLAVLTPGRLRAPESVEEIRELRPELLVLADYGQIVPRELLELPRHGALNLHPSLLPRHRGASPIPAAILGGDHETGVTLIRMDAGVDTGPIVAQRTVPLRGDETAPELQERLASVAADLLRESLGPWLAGTIDARPQSEEGATLTRALRREDGRLDPSRSATELARQVRAYQPWPGSFLQTPTGRIVIWAAEPIELASPVGAAFGPDAGEPLRGTLLPDDAGIALAVADGALRLREVQPSGGRRMRADELRRGRPGLIGTRVAAPGSSSSGDRRSDRDRAALG